MVLLLYQPDILWPGILLSIQRATHIFVRSDRQGMATALAEAFTGCACDILYHDCNIPILGDDSILGCFVQESLVFRCRGSVD